MCWTVKEIRENVWMINESGLDAMYLVKGSERSAVIDTGTGIGNFKGLIESLTDQPYTVIITHAHVDHAGGCGQFSEVYIHKKDYREAMKISVRDRENYLKNMESADAIEPGTITIAQEMRNDKKPDFCFMKEGDIFNLGDKELEIIEMPGHTAGSVCILDRKDKVLFSGDNVNDIELLCAPAQDRRRLLEDWYYIGERIFSQKDAFEVCGGGHGVISIKKALDTLDCGKEILKGKIQAEKQKVHFFNGLFYRYKNVYLYNGSFDELHN